VGFDPPRNREHYRLRMLLIGGELTHPQGLGKVGLRGGDLLIRV